MSDNYKKTNCANNSISIGRLLIWYYAVWILRFVGKPRKRCGICENCIKKDCGVCRFCLDKPRNGGKGTLKQCCIQRRCMVLKGKGSTLNVTMINHGIILISDTEKECRLELSSNKNVHGPSKKKRLQV